MAIIKAVSCDSCGDIVPMIATYQEPNKLPDGWRKRYDNSYEDSTRHYCPDCRGTDRCAWCNAPITQERYENEDECCVKCAEEE